jgi:hypothetical protein
MKRRVDNGIFCREPRVLKMGKDEIVEDGLGAAH